MKISINSQTVMERSQKKAKPILYWPEKTTISQIILDLSFHKPTLICDIAILSSQRNI